VSKKVSAKPKKLAVFIDNSSKLYDKDFYKWANTQSKLLKKGEFEKLDINNLIEEIESLGRSEKRTLRNYLVNLLMHMLKVKFQPERHGKSWDSSIRFSKKEVLEVLKDNPSLKPKLKDIFFDAYDSARLKASSETDLDVSVFPKDCPWTIEEVINS